MKMKVINRSGPVLNCNLKTINNGETFVFNGAEEIVFLAVNGEAICITNSSVSSFELQGDVKKHFKIVECELHIVD